MALTGPKDEAYGIVEQWSEAFGASDADAITNLYAPDALMIGTNGKSVLKNRDQIFKYFDLNLNTNKPRTAKLNSSEAVVVEDGTVIITGFDTVTGEKDGQSIVGMGRVTFVLARRGSDWKIIHLHRSPLPQA